MTTECGDTLFNHPTLGTLTHKPGTKYTIDCLSSCSKRDKKQVFGDEVYSSDSALCATAVHSSALTPFGGKVGIEVVHGLPNYTSKNKNNILSKSHSGTELAIKILKLSRNDFKPFVGMAVDIQD